MSRQKTSRQYTRGRKSSITELVQKTSPLRFGLAMKLKKEPQDMILRFFVKTGIPVLTQSPAQEKTEYNDEENSERSNDLNRYVPSAGQLEREFAALPDFFYTVLGTPDPAG